MTESRIRALHRFATMALPLLLAAGAAMAGCKKKKRSKMRCKLPAATVKALDQQPDDPALSIAERRARVSAVLKLCRGWPTVVKQLLEVRIATPEEHTDRIEKISDYQDINRRRERLCPGLKKLLHKLSVSVPELASAAVTRHCKLERLNVMTRREFRIDVAENMTALMAYKALRGGGLKHRTARAVARLLMGRGHVGVTQTEGSLLFPRSSSRTLARAATVLRVSKSSIAVNDDGVANIEKGRVVTTGTRGDADPRLILFLFTRLKRLAKQPPPADQTPPSDPLLAAHHTTAWSLVGNVLFTASQVGHKQIQIVVDSRSIWNHVVVADLDTTPRHKRLEPTLRLGPKTYTLHLGGTSPPMQLDATPARRTASLRAIAAHLHRADKLSNAAGRWGVIHVEVASTVSLRDVVAALDALRLQPGKMPGTCTLGYDHKGGGWRVDNRVHASCLRPYPKLHLVPRAEAPKPAPAPTPPPKK